ncbi:unnamed protein product [Rhodiola kirilowii]
MSDLDIQIPSAFDPFAESNAQEGAGTKDYVQHSHTTAQWQKELDNCSRIKKGL